MVGGGGGTAQSQDPCLGSLHGGTYLVGQPTPMPSAGGSSARAKERSLWVLRCVLGPWGLGLGTRPLRSQADQRSPSPHGGGGGGGRGWGQLRAAEGEPGRMARQDGWAEAQAGWRGDSGGGEETQGEGVRRQSLGARRCRKVGTQLRKQRNGEKVMMRVGAEG